MLSHMLKIKTFKIKNKFARNCTSLLLTVLLALAVRSFVAEPFKIPSGSMQNTLLIGDYVIVSKMNYGFSRYSLPFNVPLIPGKIFTRDPDYGDVVVFRPNYKPNMHFVKRLIGKPGDRIRIQQNVLYVNDKPAVLKKTGNFFQDHTEIAKYNNFAEYSEALPSGLTHNILLSQNLDLQRIYDKTQEYIVPPDHFFMLGDNRHGSKDSRFAEIGFIHRNQIVGKVQMVIFSLDKNKKYFFRTERFFKGIK